MTGARTALVLVDLQTWIVEMPWEPRIGADVIAACSRLRAAFDEAGAPVVHVRYHAAGDNGADAPENRIVEPLRPRDGEVLITKNGLDAFEATDLDTHLSRLEVGQLVFAGLSTAHGVAATAETAVALGYGVAVASGATASVSAREHTNTLHRLATLGARIHEGEEALSL